MTSLRLLLTVVMAVIVTLTGVTRGYPNGAPMSACGEMFPTGHHVDAKSITPPFTLSATPTTVSPGDTVTVTVEATGNADYPYFEGVLVQARKASDCNSTSPVGTFSIMAGDTFLKLLNCGGISGSAVTHTAAEHMTNVTFTWTAPADEDRIYFRATVVKNKENFWTNVFSPYVTFTGDSSQEPSEYCTVRSQYSSSVSAVTASLCLAFLVTTFAFLWNV